MSKKRGKHIKHRIAVIPLNAKANRYEIHARAALLALRSGVAQESHLVDLYVLADLCERLGAKAHISAHCGAVKRLCDEIHGAGYQSTEMRSVAMEASADILLEWFASQRNCDIAKIAHAMWEKLSA